MLQQEIDTATDTEDSLSLEEQCSEDFELPRQKMVKYS